MNHQKGLATHQATTNDQPLLHKPSYDDLTLAQWASGQIANILLGEDHTLSKNILIQMAGDISSIDILLKVADCILSTGVPNYQAARITIKSGLNVESWEKHLQDYSDKRVLQYIKFGYPLSLNNPHELCNKEISNHYSACQFPSQVQYIDKEKKLGALLCPIHDINHD